MYTQLITLNKCLLNVQCKELKGTALQDNNGIKVVSLLWLFLLFGLTLAIFV
jgi:hypothetical protein